MPALDHLKLPGDNSKHTPSSGSSGPWLGKDLTIGSSLSVDGLRLHQVRSMDDHGSTSSNRHLLLVTKCVGIVQKLIVLLQGLKEAK